MAKMKIGSTQHLASHARARDAKANWMKWWKKNAHLQAQDKARYSPYVLFHGDKRKTTTYPNGAPPDEVEKPQPSPPKKVGEQTNAHHPHEVMLAKLRLRVQVLDEDSKAMAGATYTLEFGGKKVEEVVTDGKVEKVATDKELKLDDNGMLDVIIPNDKITEANALLRVKLPPPPKKDGDKKDEEPPPPDEWLEWTVTIGRLNPIKGKAPDEWCIAGVQQRLNNLGFGAGTIDGICGRWTRSALSRFQLLHKIKEDKAEITRFQTEMKIDKDKHPFPNAIPGTKTRAALEKLHDTESTSLKDKPKPKPAKKDEPKTGQVKTEDKDKPQKKDEEQDQAKAQPAPTDQKNKELEDARKKVKEAEDKYKQTQEKLKTAMREKQMAGFGARPSQKRAAQEKVDAASRENDKAFRELDSARNKLRKLESGG